MTPALRVAVTGPCRRGASSGFRPTGETDPIDAAMLGRVSAGWIGRQVPRSAAQFRPDLAGRAQLIRIRTRPQPSEGRYHASSRSRGFRTIDNIHREDVGLTPALAIAEPRCSAPRPNPDAPSGIGPVATILCAEMPDLRNLGLQAASLVGRRVPRRVGKKMARSVTSEEDARASTPVHGCDDSHQA